MRSKSLTRTPLPDQPIPVQHAPSEQQYEEPVTRTPLPDQPIPVQHVPTVQRYEEPVYVQGAYPPSSPPAPAARSPEPHRTPAPGSRVPAQSVRQPSFMPSSAIWGLSSFLEDSPTLSSKQVAELLRSLASRLEYADVSLRHPVSQTCPEGGR